MYRPVRTAPLTGFEAAATFDFAATHLPRTLDTLQTACNYVVALPGSVTFSMAGEYSTAHQRLAKEAALPGGQPVRVEYTFSAASTANSAFGFEDVRVADISPSPEVLAEAAGFLGSIATLPLYSASANAMNRVIVIGSPANFLGVSFTNEQAIHAIRSQRAASPIDSSPALYVASETASGKTFGTVFDPYGSRVPAHTVVAQFASQNPHA